MVTSDTKQNQEGLNARDRSPSKASSASTSNSDEVGMLLYAASLNNLDEMARLMDRGMSPNAKDYDKRTAAHIAASEGHLDALRLLEERGADFSERDRWGGTCLDDAMMENHKECIEYLRSINVPQGIRKRVINEDTAADVENEDDRRAIDPESQLAKRLSAAARGNMKVLQEMLKKEINDSDYDQRTALHVAASEGQLEAAEYLVSQGALINARDRWGHTPLDEAIRGNFTELIEFLREHGGEATGAYDSIIADVSEAEMRKLQSRGIQEKWALSKEEINLSARPFARGAGGELFKAKWRGLKVVAKSCANMVSNKQALIDLGNEISLLSTLRHPNLVMFLGASFEDFPPLLLMEFCAGGTLEERIVKASAEGKPLSKQERIKYTFELALGMNFLHLCNPSVVHRDLKPSNILLTADGNLKITDFGLSKFIPSKNKKMNDQFKMTGETGSYRYMAPEVFKHEQYNEKVDVYSYSLIVYWIFTLVRPFVHHTDPVEAVRAAALNGQRPQFSNSFDKDLKKLICECWEQDPDKRPDFAQVLTRLEGLGFESIPLFRPAKCLIC